VKTVRVCKSRWLNSLSREAYCRKKVNKKLLRFCRSWNEVKKMVNTRPGCKYK